MADGFLFALDIGNTNIVLGVFDGDELKVSWRLATMRGRTADELGLWTRQFFEIGGIDPSRITGLVISSVVPPLTRTAATMAERYFRLKPLIVDGDTQTGMPILYENPAEVGADRIVNGIGAFERYGRQAGRGVIVVDFGTATTFDVITQAGEYFGGVICPGIQISADALFERAARLPRVDVRAPTQVIGRTTIDSMESGLFYGYADLVNGLVQRIGAELGQVTTCVATGGLADVIAAETPAIEHIDPELTLHGLRMVWNRNR